jgi:hypothetical protein
MTPRDRIRTNPARRDVLDIALHLIGDLWVASCQSCGCELAAAEEQEAAEATAVLPCPGCQPAPRPASRSLPVAAWVDAPAPLALAGTAPVGHR